MDDYKIKELKVRDIYKTFYRYKFARRENKRFFRFGLVKQGTEVVKGVSMELKRGEIIGLLGPNGAGKTTTFYTIVGLILPDKGKILLDDEDISQLPMYKRARIGIGYLSQEPSIFRKLSIEDNIKAILELRNLSKKEIHEESEKLLVELDIMHIRKHIGYQLSGGERRRTEIARTLATDPHFLLLDEPFAGIDPITVLEIQRIIEKLKEKGIGVLITDHNARETLRITDRSYIMAKGKILFQGSPMELSTNKEVKEIYLGESFIL